MDAPSETLFKLNNVNDNLPVEKYFPNLGLFYVSTGFKRGGGAGTKIFKRGGLSQKGGLNHNT